MIDVVFAFLYRLIDIVPFAWLQPEFMKNALVAVLLVAPVTALIGVHLTAFRMAFFADAVSHSAFTGVALGFLFAVQPVLSMAVFAVIIAIVVVRVERTSSLAPDSVISVIMSAAIAVGLAIASYRKTFMRDLSQYLFGDILTVTHTDILLLMAAAVVVAVFFVVTFNRLTLLSLNEHIAVKRFPRVAWTKLAFSLLTAVMVALSIKIIGMLLITSMLIIPAASARLIARNMRDTVWVSVIASVVASVTGLVASYYLDISTGPAIIILLSVFFAVSYVAALVLERRGNHA
ncbi:MAG: metal ABC transporter permease [Spirochaetes bacterium]|nr:metal ABC transporter permease [Spirochaetota bacterium]